MEGWSYFDVVFLGALINIVTGTANGLFRQFRSLENFIISGDLDIFLIRPRSVVFQIMTHEIDFFTIIGTVIPNLLVAVYCLMNMQISWSFRKIFLLIGAIIFGIIFYGCLFFMIGCLSFWFYRTNNPCMTLLYSVQDFINYPINIYSRVIVVILTYIFPIGFINYYPLLFLKGKYTGNIEIIMLTIIAIMVGLCCIVWRQGFKRYQSSGS